MLFDIKYNKNIPQETTSVLGVINNTDNVDSYESNNIWNSTKEITCTYKGTTYKSYLGNYWSDYEGTDVDGDGIGNTTYRIEADNDFYPLIQSQQNYVREENISKWYLYRAKISNYKHQI